MTQAERDIKRKLRIFKHAEERGNVAKTYRYFGISRSTYHGHEFQAKFHWHVADLGINHVYIKPRTPRLNGKVERSHRADEQEFYQLLHYTDNVDLNKKLKIWENFYNFHRPHGAFKGKTPYEILKEKISDGQNLLSVV